MDGVRRRLRDVGKTVSGVLGVRLGEGDGPERAEPAPPPGTPVDAPPPAAPPAEAPAADGSEASAEEAAASEPAAAASEPAVASPGGQGLAGNEPAAPAPAAPDPALAPAAEGAPTPEPAPAPATSPDPVLAAAAEQAREAAVEVAGAVGEHLGVEVDGPPELGPVLTHSFASTDRAYVGWRWAVTLARAEGSKRVTVDEVVLLPGAGALLAPPWVPWNERVQPGDLSAGDLLPPPDQDARLVPAYADPEGEPVDELVDEVHWELGLGRPRVLSREGRAEAAQRWEDGPPGPDAPVARQAPGRCADCGFLVPLAGGLRRAFGVCANAYAPDDGRVVALSHGCGAHSETVVAGAHTGTSGMAVEHDELELVRVGDAADEDS